MSVLKGGGGSGGVAVELKKQLIKGSVARSPWKEVEGKWLSSLGGSGWAGH
jgi:hypothetical protein